MSNNTNSNNNQKQINPYEQVKDDIVDGVIRKCDSNRIIHAILRCNVLSNKYKDKLMSTPDSGTIEEHSPITQPRPYNLRPRSSAIVLCPSPPSTNNSIPNVNRHSEHATDDTLCRHVDGSNAIATAPAVDVEVSSTLSFGDMDSISLMDLDAQPSDPSSDKNICTLQFAGISEEENTRSTPATHESSRTSCGSSVEKEKNGVNIHSDAQNREFHADAHGRGRSDGQDSPVDSLQKKPAALPDKEFQEKQRRQLRHPSSSGNGVGTPVMNSGSVSRRTRARRSVTTCAGREPDYCDDSGGSISSYDGGGDGRSADRDPLYVPPAAENTDFGGTASISSRTSRCSGSAKRKRRKELKNSNRKKSKATTTSRSDLPTAQIRRKVSRPRRKKTSKDNETLVPNSLADSNRFRHIRIRALLKKNSLDTSTSLQSPTKNHMEDPKWAVGKNALYNVACDLTPRELGKLT
jgi:hypothetical protein